MEKKNVQRATFFSSGSKAAGFLVCITVLTCFNKGKNAIKGTYSYQTVFEKYIYTKAVAYAPKMRK